METSITTTNQTRELLLAFADLLYAKKDVAGAFNGFVHADYIQHNPAASDGRDAAIEMLTRFFAAAPGLSFDVKRVLVDGDMAVVHTHVRMHPDDAGMAVVDMFRVEGGRIVEHWDVMQPVPDSSANANTMF